MSDALVNGLAGAGGGIISQLITYPLLTINTRQQTWRDPKIENQKLGTIELLCQVVKREGWDQLYGGLVPSLIGTAASQGVYYYFYQLFWNKAKAIASDRKRKNSGDGSVGMISFLVIAALSGCVNTVLTNPIWVVVTRMQTHKETSKNLKVNRPPDDPSRGIYAAKEHCSYGTTDAVQEIYNEAGVWGFWKGVSPSLIMVSNPSIQFMLYETMLKKLKQSYPSTKRGFIAVSASELFLGAASKLGATLLTYPLLVVKSRLQAKEAPGRRKYKGTIDAIIKMVRYEGLYGLYNGMGTRIVQSVLAAAILFMVKQELVVGVKRLLSNTGNARNGKIRHPRTY